MRKEFESDEDFIFYFNTPRYGVNVLMMDSYYFNSYIKGPGCDDEMLDTIILMGLEYCKRVSMTRIVDQNTSIAIDWRNRKQFSQNFICQTIAFDIILN